MRQLGRIATIGTSSIGPIAPRYSLPKPEDDLTAVIRTESEVLRCSNHWVLELWLKLYRKNLSRTGLSGD